MNAQWQPWLAIQRGALDDNGVLTLPDEAAQMAAMRKGNTWSPLTDFALLQISGEDAATFLQGQFSSDVRQLDDESQAQYSSYSTAKGRMLASFLLWRRDGNYYLLLSRDLAADTVKRLSMFVMRAKVKIVDISEQTALIGAWGQRAEQTLSSEITLPPSPCAISVKDDVCAIRLLNGTVLIVGDAGRCIPALETVEPVDSNVWRLLDMAAGIVWVQAATKEGFVPQMANMDVIGAVSFTKGCYPGQEIVARAQYRGQIKRHLYRVRSDAPLSAGDELASAETGEQAIGLLADVCKTGEDCWQALAVVQDAAWDGSVFVKARPAQSVQRVCRQPVVIRPYLPGDQQRVLDLWLAASREGHAFLSEDELQRQYAQVRDAYLSGAQIFVAERSGEVQGFICLLGNFVGDLFVEPQAQNIGIGGALVAYVAAFHRELETEAYTQNERALAFFQALGFAEYRRKDTDADGQLMQMVALRRT